MQKHSGLFHNMLSWKKVSNISIFLSNTYRFTSEDTHSSTLYGLPLCSLLGYYPLALYGLTETDYFSLNLHLCSSGEKRSTFGMAGGWVNDKRENSFKVVQNSIKVQWIKICLHNIRFKRIGPVFKCVCEKQDKWKTAWKYYESLWHIKPNSLAQNILSFSLCNCYVFISLSV